MNLSLCGYSEILLALEKFGFHKRNHDLKKLNKEHKNVYDEVQRSFI